MIANSRYEQRHRGSRPQSTMSFWLIWGFVALSALYWAWQAEREHRESIQTQQHEHAPDTEETARPLTSERPISASFSHKVV